MGHNFSSFPSRNQVFALAAVLMAVWSLSGLSSLHAQTAYSTTQTSASSQDTIQARIGAPKPYEVIPAPQAVTPVAPISFGSTMIDTAPSYTVKPWTSTSILPTTPIEPLAPDVESSPLRPIWENLAIYAGIDGSRGPEDLGVNANFGARVGIQTAFPLLEAWGVGVQVGSSLNYHEDATRFIRLAGGPGNSTQVFSTLGVFQRTDSGWNWGITYDYLNYQGYATVALAQWRGQIGYQWDPQNEFGVWGTYRDRGDTATFDGETFAFRSINQANFFWTHFWPTQAMTKVWAGVADSHGDVILGVPGNSRSDHPFVFGTSLQIPLNDSIALYGEANFITPNDSGTVHAFLGVVYYPGGNTARALYNRFAPLLPLPNNPNFAQDVRR